MPSLVKIKVVSARDLNEKDTKKKGKAESFTDSYVNITLGNQEQQRTQTIKKTTHPVWDEEFRFEVVDDSLLQNTPVEFKVIDQDLYSSEMIGVVYIDLSPLIMRTAHGEGSDNMQKDLVIEGWFPLYDTLQGIQGSLNVAVKLQYIGNDNPFRDSSAGVQFFSSSTLSPSEFLIQDVLGLVTDLVVEDDPEMSWHDYFRAAKSSNDSRLRVLYRLSATVRKEVGKKVLEAGGNAVLGYSSHFDVEGDSGIVVRAYGTACRLLKLEYEYDDNEEGTLQSSIVDRNMNRDTSCSTAISGGSVQHADLNTSLQSLSVEGFHQSPSPPLPPPPTLSNFCSSNTGTRSSLSRLPSGPGGSATKRVLMRTWSSTQNAAGLGANDPISAEDGLNILSLKSFDPHVRIRYGGLVMAKSVKFLGKLASSLSDQETREGWWEEIRDEIKNHASTLCCSHVVGYSEYCTIYGDVCVLTCAGTAATVSGFSSPLVENITTGADVEIQADRDASNDVNPLTHLDAGLLSEHQIVTSPKPNLRAPRVKSIAQDRTSRRRRAGRPCAAVHVPYNRNRAPYSFMRLVPCMWCRKHWVPEYLLATVEVPENLPIRGKGRLLEVVVHRSRKKQAGAEMDAVKMSEVLPFIEFDLQRQIMLKLKVFGMNAVFGYTSSLQFGGSMILATATCTAVYVEALPPPQPLQISRNIRDIQQDSHLSQVQANIESLCHINKLSMDAYAGLEKSSKKSKRDRADGTRSGSSESSSSSSSLSSSSTSSSDSEFDSSSLEDPSLSSSSSSSTESDDDEGDEDNDNGNNIIDNKDEDPDASAISGDTAYKEIPQFTRRSRSKSNVSDDSFNIQSPHGRKKLSAKSKRSTGPLASFRNKKKKRAFFEDDRRPYIIEIDEETDLDLMAVLTDRAMPPFMDLVNTQTLPSSSHKLDDSSGLISGEAKLLTSKEIKVMRRVKVGSSSGRGNLKFPINQIFQEAYSRLCFPLRSKTPCEILGLKHCITVLDDSTIEIFFMAVGHYAESADPNFSSTDALSPSSINQLSLALSGSAGNIPGLKSLIPLEAFAFQNLQRSMSSVPSSARSMSMTSDPAGDSSSTVQDVFRSKNPIKNITSTNQAVANVTLTSLSYVPGRRILRYLGPLQLHFIKESWGVTGKSLLGNFFHMFQSEIDAAARAQVVALGGNALICHKIVPLESGSSVSRNQVYNMISIYGDVVLVV